MTANLTMNSDQFRDNICGGTALYETKITGGFFIKPADSNFAESFSGKG